MSPCILYFPIVSGCVGTVSSFARRDTVGHRVEWPSGVIRTCIPVRVVYLYIPVPGTKQIPVRNGRWPPKYTPVSGMTGIGQAFLYAVMIGFVIVCPGQSIDNVGIHPRVYQLVFGIVPLRFCVEARVRPDGEQGRRFSKIE